MTEENGKIKNFKSCWSDVLLREDGSAYLTITVCGFKFRIRFFSDTDIDELHVTDKFYNNIAEIIIQYEERVHIFIFETEFIKLYPEVEFVDFHNHKSAILERDNTNIISVKIK